MTDTEKLQFLLTKLQETANSKHCFDDYGDDYSPSETGNYDEAFDVGAEYGEIEFSRSLLEQVELYESTFNKLCEPHND
jgi:hypothetical protein